MASFWDFIGTTITGFLKTLADLWYWLTNPLMINGVPLSIGGWEVVPIQMFGAGFGIIVVALIIKSLVTM